MDFLDEMGRKISETVDTVSKKAEETFEVQRLRNQINSLERKNEKDYIELGKMVFSRYQNRENIDTVSAGYCEEIVRRDVVIEQYKNDMAEKKGMEKCPACGAHIEKESAFCNYCGEKVGF